MERIERYVALFFLSILAPLGFWAYVGNRAGPPLPEHPAPVVSAPRWEPPPPKGEILTLSADDGRTVRLLYPKRWYCAPLEDRYVTPPYWECRPKDAVEEWVKQYEQSKVTAAEQEQQEAPKP